MKWLLLGLAVGFVLLLGGCTVQDAKPKIINEPPLNVSVDDSYLKENCYNSYDSLTNTYSKYTNTYDESTNNYEAYEQAAYCNEISLKDEFQCDRIEMAANSGGLTPRLPLLACIMYCCNTSSPDFHKERRKGNLFYVSSGPFTTGINYIVIQDDSFKLIRNKDEFKEVFAPVETKEEALSFAVIFTQLDIQYSPSLPNDVTYFVSEIEGTHVEETVEGFKVRLFFKDGYGCGKHPTYAVDYLVGVDGEVSEITRTKIYEENVYMCVD